MKPPSVDEIMKDASNPIRNYVVPGLTSWLITAPSSNGCDRVFEMTREQLIHVTPHSHRFDFTAQVIRGYVINQIWRPSNNFKDDAYQRTQLVYDGSPGRYHKGRIWKGMWDHTDNTYLPGQWYGMRYDQIHSIIFGKGTVVLFKEERTQTDKTDILEPIVDNQHIPLFQTPNWMFKK